MQAAFLLINLQLFVLFLLLTYAETQKILFKFPFSPKKGYRMSLFKYHFSFKKQQTKFEFFFEKSAFHCSRNIFNINFFRNSEGTGAIKSFEYGFCSLQQMALRPISCSSCNSSKQFQQMSCIRI